MKFVVVIAILLNVFWLAALFYEAATDDITAVIPEFVLEMLVVVTPLVNLFILLSGRVKWMTVYFKRKALEEQKKIDELKS